ncbi:MAG TPA: hypothetical protein VEA69_07535 [Tepidisphaeraceae bacterium]|nr:hypothetical protein [Tepidisphaeraceae bacterium]
MAIPLIRNTNLARIEFAELHNAPWAAANTQIGLTATECTALATKTTAARNAYEAQQALKNQLKAATVDADEKVRILARATSDALKRVRAKAGEVGGNSVYVLAEIPPPATPSPVGPPGTPYELKVGLNPDGTIKLSWKCANPAGAHGTIYTVGRRTPASGPFTQVGGSGTRSFVDATLPAGAPSVTYQIQAVRSTLSGLAAQFTVNFGVSGGEAVATVVQGGAPKLAA